jgi:hypothetical protein
MRMKTLAVLGLLLTAATPAVAQTQAEVAAAGVRYKESIPNDDCNAMPRPRPDGESMAVYRVVGHNRVSALGGPGSLHRPLVVGEPVAVYGFYRGQACVGALGRDRWGWIPQSRIVPEPNRPALMQWWIGTWKSKDGPMVTIEQRHGGLFVTGGDELIGDRPAYIEGMAEVSGSGLLVREEGVERSDFHGGPPCFAKLVRLGEGILVNSDGCANGFSGSFTRKSRHVRRHPAVD